MGSGGNNTAFCIAGNTIGREPENGGNGIGVQEDVAFTLTGSDRHSVYARQRVDVFQEDAVTSTQSARQHKDATDLVLQQSPGPLLIRRLLPIECERLQGYPDFWTDIPGASDSARYRALGNSVSVNVVEFIMRGIAHFLSHER